MFTRRHYEWLARFIKKEIDHNPCDSLAASWSEYFAIQLADALEQSSTTFKRAKFLEACGVKDYD